MTGLSASLHRLAGVRTRGRIRRPAEVSASETDEPSQAPCGIRVPATRCPALLRGSCSPGRRPSQGHQRAPRPRRRGLHPAGVDARGSRDGPCGRVAGRRMMGRMASRQPMVAFWVASRRKASGGSGGTAQIRARPVDRRHSPAAVGACPGICHPLPMTGWNHTPGQSSRVRSAAAPGRLGRGALEMTNRLGTSGWSAHPPGPEPPHGAVTA
jgi:hypothetical protein